MSTAPLAVAGFDRFLSVNVMRDIMLVEHKRVKVNSKNLYPSRCGCGFMVHFGHVQM